MDGPVVIPGLYDGRNKTFFMAAYEGVRGEAITSPLASVPTAAMRQGNFSEITTPIRNPFTGQPFAGNIIPADACCRRRRSNCCGTTRRPTCRARPTTSRARAPNTDNVDQVLARVDQNLGNKIRLNVRYNWHDSFNTNVFNAAIPVTAVTQPRVNKNWLFSYTHTLRPNLLNDFRIGYHRLDFDTVNPFYVSGPADAGTILGIPGFDGDTRYNNPGLPSINISKFSGLRRRRHELVPVRHDIPGVERDGVHARIAQRAARLRSAAAGHGPPGGQRPARASFRTSPATSAGYSVADFMLGLPRTVIPPTDQIQGHVGGWRNGFFVNDVWQAVAQPDAEPRPALRAEHARPDLRRSRLDARGGLTRPSSRARSRARASSSTSPNYKDFAPAARRHLSPRREDGRCARASAFTTTRTR